MIIRISLAILIVISSSTTYSQVLPVSLIPTENNGSFAGMSDQSRLIINNSHNSANISRPSFFASYDSFLKLLSTGVGISIHNYDYSTNYVSFDNLIDESDPDQTDNFFNNTINYQHNYRETVASLSVAPKLSLKGKYTISPSLKFTYGQGNVRLIRDDVQVYNRNLENVNVVAGIAVNTYRSYIGYSIMVYGQDKIDFSKRYISNNPPIIGKYYSVLEGGHTFFRKNESRFTFTPQLAVFIYNFEGDETVSIRKIKANARFKYSNILYGHSAGLINGSSYVAAHIGWQNDNFRIILNLSSESNNFLDVNLRFIIPHKTTKNQKPTFW